MDAREFTDRVVACEEKLFRIAYLTLGGYAQCEDAVQEALVKAWAGRNSLRDPAYFETWLVRILLNECHNLQRRARPEAELPENYAPAKPSDPGLRDALAALDGKYRAPLILRHVAGYSVAEAAKILRVTAGVVKWRLEQAKRKLREMLSDGEGSK
jgi:RNA polymerase sigma-70 factor (ECF subfamily)